MYVKTFRTLTAALAVALAAPAVGQAQITQDLVAYYDFEETGAAGLVNKAPGASTHNGAYITTPGFGGGSGFTGDAAFEGINPTQTTDRSTLLVGNALNVVQGAGGGGHFTVSSLTSRGNGADSFGSLGTTFTVSAWFNLAPDPDNGAGTRDFVFEAANNYDISFGTNTVDGTTYASWVGQVAAFGATELPANEWHHVVHAFESDGTTTTLSVYINGDFIASGTATTTSVNFQGINFGTARTDQDRVFDGLLDEVALWSRALSAAEAAELYNMGLSGTSLLQAVPEPSTYAMLAALAGVGLFYHRRRRMSAAV